MAAAREDSLQKSLEELQGCDGFRPGAGTCARAAARGRSEPYALQIVSRPLQGRQRAGKPGDAGSPYRYTRRNPDPSFISKISLLLGLALLLGPSLGCVLALASDYFDGPIKTLEQAAAISDLPRAGRDPVGCLARACPTGQARKGRTGQVRSAEGAAIAPGIAARAHALRHRGAQLDVRRGDSDDPARTPARHQSQDRTSRDGHICPGRRRQDHPGRKSRPIARRRRDQDGVSGNASCAIRK